MRKSAKVPPKNPGNCLELSGGQEEGEESGDEGEGGTNGPGPAADTLLPPADRIVRLIYEIRGFGAIGSAILIG